LHPPKSMDRTPPKPARWFLETGLLMLVLIAGPCQAHPARIPVPIKSTVTPTSLPTLTRTAASTRTAAPTGLPPTATTVQSPSPPATEPVPAAPLYYDHPQRYRITYIAVLANSAFRVNSLQVYQPRPLEWDSQRDVSILQVLPPAEERSDPTYGNGLYYWDQTRLSRDAVQQNIVLQFETTVYETHSQFNERDIRPYDTTSAEYSLYTRPERYLEADDPQIRLLVTRMASSEPNPYRLARKFYEYVIRNAIYVATWDGVHGASQLVRKGRGDCSDYAALFVAFCRAAGIPARPVVGYWAESGLSKSHVWAEFYLQGIGWLPVDPNMGQVEYYRRGDYFGNMDNQRIILNKGYNVPLDPPMANGFLAPFLQVPWLWYTGSGGSLSLDRVAWGVDPLP
jgi:transglutaminase-like putative cysteine protease